MPRPEIRWPGNADAIRFGTGLYRARCADCHGMDARGVRAPDLTQVWASGPDRRRSVQDAARTACPAPRCRPDPRMFDQEIVADPGVPAHARRVGADRSAEGQRRERRAGLPRQLRQLSSRERHAADGSDRTCRASASARTRDVMVKQIRGATEDFRPGYEPVTLTRPDGQADSRREEKRRPLLRADHGHARADSGLSRKTR